MGRATVDGGLTASTPPKLSLLSSFPSKTKYSETPPGMVTPPLRTSTISIPFQWEEAPGKPRNSNSGGGGGAARCLELPPRLLPEGNKVISSSPTTVLDGPYIGRSVSLRRGGSFRGLEGKERVLFGSSRWGDYVAADGGFKFLSSDVNDGDGGGGGGRGTQVKITRIRRKGSFLRASHAGSHVWGSIYASLKQVVPWRRGREKNRSKTS